MMLYSDEKQRNSGAAAVVRFLPTARWPGVASWSNLPLRRQAGILGFGLAYFLLCRLSLAFVFEKEGVAGIWPAAGVALAGLLLYGRRNRLLFLAVIGVANFAANLLSDRGLLVCVALVIPNLLEPCLGEFIYRCMAGHSIRVDTLRRAAVLVFVAAPISSVAGGAVGASLVHGLAGIDLWLTFRGWWIADNLGILTTAPMILLVFASRRVVLPTRYYLELAAFVVAHSGLAIWVFSAASAAELIDLRRPYTLIALLTWAAFRLKARDIAVLCSITCFITIWFTSRGLGLFAVSHAAAFSQLLDAELYLSIVASTSLLVAAVINDRQRHHRRLMRAIAERGAFEREQHLRLITDAFPAFISYIDKDRRYRFNNRHYELVTGSPAKSFRGRHVREVLGEVNYARVAPHLQQALEGKPVSFEFEFQASDGSVSQQHVTYVPHTSEEGVPLGLYCLSTDITARKAVDEQLRRHRDNLAKVASLITLGELAGGLAHELNQPLSAIHNYARGCVRRLEEPGANVVALRDAVQEIATEAARAGSIISTLRRHFGQREPDRRPVPLEEMVERVLLLAQHDLRQAGVVTQYHDSTGRQTVLVDPIQIEQVLLNLIRNACDAMHDVGRTKLVEIRVRSPQPEQVEVAVVDRGAGFTEEESLRMFDTFFTTKRDGLGMGLAISRSIIESHGGRLWAERNEFGGATFRFTLMAASS